jgi:hypothetical protein
MNQNGLNVGATIRKWAVLGWVVACALWVLAHDGISGVFSVAIFALLVFSALSRKSGRKQQDAAYIPPWLGPTDYHRHHDPAYKDLYPWNFFKDGK